MFEDLVMVHLALHRRVEFIRVAVSFPPAVSQDFYVCPSTHSSRLLHPKIFWVTKDIFGSLATEGSLGMLLMNVVRDVFK